MRYRLYVHLYDPARPPTTWKGACSFGVGGPSLDMPDLPLDVQAAICSGLRKHGRWGSGVMLQHGRYLTYGTIREA